MEVIVKPNKKYNNYWIPAIPKNWDFKKTTWIFEKIGSGTTPKSDNPEYYDNGDINWILTGDLNDSYLISTSKKVTQKALEDFSTLKIYPRNSLVIAMYGATIGKIALTDIDACTNQACCILSEPINSNTKFYFYWFLANRQHIISLGYGGGQPNISQEIIKSLRLPCPQITEQKKIVTFLDQKCALIDALIDKKQKLVELKKEERTALINQAVTKGLDSNAPLKDTGIEWLGEIPKHWEVKKIKHIAFLKSGEGIKSEQIDKLGNYPVFGGNGLRGYYSDYTHEGEFVLIGRQGALCGNINYVSGKFWASEHAVVVNLSPSYFIMWVGELLRSMNLNQYSISAAQPGLSVERISNIKIPVPTFDEQKQMANYFKRVNNNYNSIITKFETEMALLKEYKTTLISEAVTGKLSL